VPLKLFLPGPLRLRLLVPSIALIVAATMIPAGLRHPSIRYIDYQFGPFDFLNNLLLYLPLGIALSGSSLIRTVVIGFSLSTAAELLQLGYIDRIPSPFDIASNTCGALLGYLAAIFLIWATGHDPKSLRVPRAIAATGILIAILGTLLLVHYPAKTDFSNWDPSFHLAVGNELTGNRPWAGSISELGIYPFAMAPSQIEDLARRERDPNPLQPAELPSGGLIPAWNAATDFGQPLLSQQQELAFYEALAHQNQLTLLVLMRPNNLEQSGPARIVTYSQDADSRNFTLGQIHDRLTFRLRTPTTGYNGTDPALYSGPVLSLDHISFVAAVYDGRISSLFVDGKCVAQVDLGAKRPHLPRRLLRWLPRSIPIREIELGAAEMLLSALFSLGLFAFGGVPSRTSMRFFAGALAGAMIGGATWIFGVSHPILGMRILLECIASGLVIAASVEMETAGDGKLSAEEGPATS
jgi:hypothetical protein